MRTLGVVCLIAGALIGYAGVVDAPGTTDAFKVLRGWGEGLPTFLFGVLFLTMGGNRSAWNGTSSASRAA